MYSKTAFTCSGCAVFDREFGHLGLAHGLDAQVAHSLVEALRQQGVDDFLANLARKAAANHRLRHLAGAETGNLGIFAVVGGDAAVGLRDLFGRNVQHQLAGALRVQDRAVLMAFVVVTCMIVTFVSVIFVPCACRSFCRFWLKVVFDGVGRTQRFAFQARTQRADQTCHFGGFPAASPLFHRGSRTSSRTQSRS